MDVLEGCEACRMDERVAISHNIHMSDTHEDPLQGETATAQVNGNKWVSFHYHTISGSLKTLGQLHCT